MADQSWVENIRQLDRVVATFAPKQHDTLRPASIPHIGWRGEWQAIWEIEEGTYVGQMAWMPTGISLGWVPSEDLDDVTLPVTEAEQ